MGKATMHCQKSLWLFKQKQAAHNPLWDRSRWGRTMLLPWKVWQSRTKSVQASEAYCSACTAISRIACYTLQKASQKQGYAQQ